MFCVFANNNNDRLDFPKWASSTFGQRHRLGLFQNGSFLTQRLCNVAWAAPQFLVLDKHTHTNPDERHCRHFVVVFLGKICNSISKNNFLSKRVTKTRGIFYLYVIGFGVCVCMCVGKGTSGYRVRG